jgi:hypothetical protein
MIHVPVSFHRNQGVTVVARVNGADGNNVTQDDFATATYTLFVSDEANASTRTAVTGHQDISVSLVDTIYNTLQEDGYWGTPPIDDTGYNLRYFMDASVNSAFTQVGKWYELIIYLVPSSGPVVQVPFAGRCVS